MDRAQAKDFKGNYRLCPFPGTRNVFGTNKVPVLICTGCKYAKHYPWHGGVSCEYGKEE